MNGNRRNYYRILHVQPEAPLAVVTASYRTLMTKLRNHPDLGGSHEIAAMINNAYAVLRHPKLRAAYDRTLKKQHSGAHARAQTSQSNRHHYTHCLFCAEPAPAVVLKHTTCRRCHSPLFPLADTTRRRTEMFGRRCTLRIARTDPALLYTNTHSPPIQARLRDLSRTGGCLVAAHHLEEHQIIRIISSAFHAIAIVVSCQVGGGLYTVRVRLLTARQAQNCHKKE